MSLIKQEKYKQVYRQGFETWKSRDKKEDERAHFLSFMQEIKKELRIQISFDAEIVEVLKDTIEHVKRGQRVDYLHQHLTQMRSFSEFLYNRKFIEQEHKNSILRSITREKEGNDDLSIYTLSKYLGSCESKEEFDVEWNNKSPIQPYDVFWEHYLVENRLGIKDKLNQIYSCFVTYGMDTELPEGIRRQLDDYFSTMNGDNPEQVEINLMLERMVEMKLLRENSAEMQQFDNQYNMVKNLLSQFNYIVEDTKRFQIKTAKFGSLCNGFATHDADLDITIITNCYVEEKRLIHAMANVMQYRLQDTDYRVHSLAQANTPIIQIKKIGSKADKIDIAINNICGIINSRFLKIYSQMHPGIKTLGILLKLWGKRHNLIHPTKMSSYSFILMMLYYLIKVNVVPNILTNLKGTERESECIRVKRTKKDEKEEFLIYNTFETNIKKKVTRFNVYQHLLGFMNFYKTDGRYFTQGHAISLDLSEKPIEADKIFTIKDPFDEPHNPGRWGIAYKNQIMREIDSAIRELKTLKKHTIKSLFE